VQSLLDVLRLWDGRWMRFLSFYSVVMALGMQDILESFQGTEFFYMEQAGNRSLYSSLSFRNKVVQQQDEKWWLPVPRIPSGASRTSAEALEAPDVIARTAFTRSPWPSTITFSMR
ncbi:hypothetical protein Dimus_015727, partial [Dionaea muscipula]